MIETERTTLMLARIAWKNVWRNKRRSLIMTTAIALGLWAGLFAIGIFSSIYDSMIAVAIDRDLGHLQMHAPGFREERLVSNVIPQGDSVAAIVRAIAGVKAVSARTVIDGMGSSATSSQGVRINGVDPWSERNVTAVSSHMVDGHYFEAADRLPIVVGRKLAEKLNLKVRSKVVLAFQRPDGMIVYGAFRIIGLFDTESSNFDGHTVFVRHGDLDAIAGQHLVHELVVRYAMNDSLASRTALLKHVFPTLDVAAWDEIAPELRIVQSGDLFMTIFLGIILLALLFGIMNTMLMSVMDRVKEFGVLIAIGMNRRRVFLMIGMETLFLSLTGSGVGTLLGAVSVAIAGTAGINLGWFSDGLSLYGISSHLYPFVHLVMYPILAAMVIFTSGLAAVYPALKAVRLRPAEALATAG